MSSWDEQLDQFEAVLADQRRALEDGRPQDVQAFVPQAAGPLPAGLVERARALSEQADALTAALTAATASAARQLHAATVMRRPERRTSSYVDQRG